MRLNTEGRVQRRKHRSAQRPGHRDGQSHAETRRIRVLPVAGKSAGRYAGPEPAVRLTPCARDALPTVQTQAGTKGTPLPTDQCPAHVLVQVSLKPDWK